MFSDGIEQVLVQFHSAQQAALVLKINQGLKRFERLERRFDRVLR